MQSRFRVLPLAVLLVAIALAGCLGGDTGSQNDGDDPTFPGDQTGGTTTPPSSGGDDAGDDGGSSGDDDDDSDPGSQPGNGADDPPPSGGTGGRIWGDPENATIRPGVQVTSEFGQCTSNFVYLMPAGDVLLGLAAHCFGTDGDATATDGCIAASAPIGTPATVQGATQPALLLYSSWLAMQAVGEIDGDACAYNDFALVWLHPDDWDSVHPAMIHFGGPTGMAAGDAVGAGDTVRTFGNTGLRPGPQELDEREGVVVESRGGGWSTTVYTATPGLPGDSGSGVLTGDGEALGVLVTVAVTPLPGSNGVTSLDHILAYAASMGMVAILQTSDVLDPGLLP